MLLCVDIGNTNIKLGLFEQDNMRAFWRVSTERNRLADEYAVLLDSLMETEGLEFSQITGCAISSVVPTLGTEFGHLARRYLKLDPLVLGPGVPMGIQVNTDNPAEVGTDLIAGAVAARHLYGTPVIVIGFGTATTFVAVSRAGNLEGVAIAPGVVAGAESLFRAAAVLPQIALDKPGAAIGKNTIASMQSGIIYGYAALVEGLVARMRQELGGSARVVASGGLASLIAGETAVIEAVDHDLNLVGLRLIYEQNQ